MRLSIKKNLEAGVPNVSVLTSDFTPDEQDRISRFGSPIISIKPHYGIDNQGKPVQALPVHALNNIFRFSTEMLAEEFVERITNEIKEKMAELRARKDKFSESKTYEL